MTLNDIKNILDCELICGNSRLDMEIHSACGSDMMSDVLAYVKDQSILLTGLVNCQVVRTADMMDMLCIVFVRGKKPDEDMISLANERNIALMSTSHRMFTACGLLWENGLQGGNILD
ncbi:MAG: DRTGG domain-containing protein [Oscillospiraceae bacterium]